jgi:hypothetical protein
MSSMVLSVIGSRGVTVEIGPSALWEAPGGVAVTYGLYDGPLTFTLSRGEATQLHELRGEQLTSDVEPDVWKPAT